MALLFGGGAAAERQAISRGVKTGKLVKLFTGLYTDDADRDRAAIVRENVWEIEPSCSRVELFLTALLLILDPHRKAFFISLITELRKLKFTGSPWWK
jgi:hypothetical protein